MKAADAGKSLSLDALDWTVLESAFGDGAIVGDSLRAFREAGAANDEELRAATWETLSNAIWHEGAIHSATIAAIPYLAEELESASPRWRAEILELLAGVAAGGAALAIHAERMPEGILAEEDFHRELDRQLEVAREARRTLWRHSESFRFALMDPDPVIRSRGHLLWAALLTLAADDRDDSAGPEFEAGLISRMLVEFWDREPDDLVAASAAFLLSALAARVPENLLFLRHLMSDKSPRVRLAACLALAEHAVDERVVDFLANVLARATKLRGVFPEGFPWLPRSLPLEILDRIRRLDGFWADRLTPAILTLLRELEGDDLAAAVEPILEYLFPQGWAGLPEDERATPERRALLAELAGDDRFWPEGAEGPIIRESLERAGLPTDRAALAGTLGAPSEARPD